MTKTESESDKLKGWEKHLLNLHPDVKFSKLQKIPYKTFEEFLADLNNGKVVIGSDFGRSIEVLKAVNMGKRDMTIALLFWFPNIISLCCIIGAITTSQYSLLWGILASFLGSVLSNPGLTKFWKFPITIIAVIAIVSLLKSNQIWPIVFLAGYFSWLTTIFGRRVVTAKVSKIARSSEIVFCCLYLDNVISFWRGSEFYIHFDPSQKTNRSA